MAAFFTVETLDFLEENRFENSRNWFQAHHDAYKQHVLDPLNRLAEALAPILEEIDPELLTEPRRVVSRINRDLRYCHDGLLYRNYMWLSWHRDREAYPGWPEFYFLLSPESTCWGTGHYMPSTLTMQTLRRMILEGDPAFAAARKAAERFELSGDKYKRTRYPQEPPELRDWLDRKALCAERTDITEAQYADGLDERIAADLRALAPMYRFLVAAEERARNEGAEGSESAFRRR